MLNCNRCNKPVDEQWYEIECNLPSMIGFNDGYPPVTRCAICRKPVCRECMWGNGIYVFTCKGECTDIMRKRIKEPAIDWEKTTDKEMVLKE